MTAQPCDIVHITDCHDTNPEGGFLAAAKVRLAYRAHSRRLNLPVDLIEVLPAEEFNTIDVGAKFSEIVTSNLNPQNLVVAVNAAPPSIPGGNGNNERRNFVLGRLRNGVVFGGTWGGHCLSYVKPQIAELYELLDSNNGSQFRSLEVLPGALAEFAAGRIDPRRLAPVADIARAVPDAPSQSHAWTIDNFGNIKLALSENDDARVRDLFARHAANAAIKPAAKAAVNPAANAAANVTANTALPSLRFAFGRRSVEFGLANDDLPETSFRPALVQQKLFSAEEGTTILTLTSSARRWDARGREVPVPQIATLRREPGLPCGYDLPRIGAPLHLRLTA